MNQEEIDRMIQENAMLRTEIADLRKTCSWYEEQISNAAAHNRSIGDYQTAFKMLVAELKRGQK